MQPLKVSFFSADPNTGPVLVVGHLEAGGAASECLGGEWQPGTPLICELFLGRWQVFLVSYEQGSLKDLHVATNGNVTRFFHPNKGTPPFTRQCSSV